MGPTFRNFLWKSDPSRVAHPHMSQYVSTPLPRIFSAHTGCDGYYHQVNHAGRVKQTHLCSSSSILHHNKKKKKDYIVESGLNAKGKRDGHYSREPWALVLNLIPHCVRGTYCMSMKIKPQKICYMKMHFKQKSITYIFCTHLIAIPIIT